MDGHLTCPFRHASHSEEVLYPGQVGHAAVDQAEAEKEA